MSKFNLTAKPTFVAAVSIPVPGDAAAEVKFTFKGRTRAQFKEFIEGLDDREDVDVIMEIASGWELDDPWDKTNVQRLTENYMGAARAIIEKYLSELTQARLGN